jgi:hypothetical protein
VNYDGGRKGGTLPRHVRGAFRDAVEAFVLWHFFGPPQAPKPTVCLDDDEVTISRVCGLVWNCTNFMPIELLARLLWLDGPAAPFGGFTYACGARRLRRLIVWHERSAEQVTSGNWERLPMGDAAGEVPPARIRVDRDPRERIAEKAAGTVAATKHLQSGVNQPGRRLRH